MICKGMKNKFQGIFSSLILYFYRLATLALIPKATQVTKFDAVIAFPFPLPINSLIGQFK
jgi:hypothetical protein